MKVIKCPLYCNLQVEENGLFKTVEPLHVPFIIGRESFRQSSTVGALQN